jgi:hypothetical protein
VTSKIVHCSVFLPICKCVSVDSKMGTWPNMMWHWCEVVVKKLMGMPQGNTLEHNEIDGHNSRVHIRKMSKHIWQMLGTKLKHIQVDNKFASYEECWKNMKAT